MRRKQQKTHWTNCTNLPQKSVAFSANLYFHKQFKRLCFSVALPCTQTMSRMLNVIYYIRVISHLQQEITRQRKAVGGSKGEKKIPHPACENLCQISPQTRSPSLGLASMPWIGNRIRFGMVTNLFLSQKRCPLGLHAPPQHFFILVFFRCEPLISVCEDSRSCV